MIWSHGAALLLILMVFSCLVESAAAEETHSLDISWKAPASCASQKEVVEQIFSLLPPGAGSSAGVRFVGRVKKKGGRYFLRLTLDDGQFEEERHYEAPSCEEVVGAATVAMALVMQPPSSEDPTSSSSKTASANHRDDSAAERADGSNRSGKKTGAQKTARKKDGSTSQEDDGRKRKRAKSKDESVERGDSLRLIISAPTFSMSLGLLPRVGWGLGAGAGVEVARWRLLLSGTWYLDNNVSSSDYAESSAELNRSSYSLSSCRWISRGRVEWAPCLRFSLEHLNARGEGANVTPQEEQTYWMALGPGVVARVRINGSIALVAGTALEFQTARPQIVIAGQGELAQVNPLTLTTNVGAEWNF